MLDFCPICQKKFKDILKHFAYYHEIGDIGRLKRETEIAEIDARRIKEYGDFIDKINEKLEKKEITVPKWKELRDRWEKEHSKA